MLLTGDLQVGYWHTELKYSGAQILQGESALKAALFHRPTEIWYDEFEKGTSVSAHGFLLASRSSGALRSAGEFRTEFTQFDFSQTAADGRKLPTSDDRSEWGD